MIYAVVFFGKDNIAEIEIRGCGGRGDKLDGWEDGDRVGGGIIVVVFVGDEMVRWWFRIRKTSDKSVEMGGIEIAKLVAENEGTFLRCSERVEGWC